MPDQVVTVNKSSNERTSKCPTLIGIAAQRGVLFDALIALVRASRPQSIWHLHKARSRVATHIRVEQIPGLMQSACHEALALATARKAKAALLPRTSANLYTERLPFVFLSRRHWHSFHLQIVPSLLARLSSQPVGQKKTSKQYSENCQSNNQCDSDNIILHRK